MEFVLNAALMNLLLQTCLPMKQLFSCILLSTPVACNSQKEDEKKSKITTVAEYLNKGVKPEEIAPLGTKTVAGLLNISELEYLRISEDDFTEHLFSINSKDNFTVKEPINFLEVIIEKKYFFNCLPILT